MLHSCTSFWYQTQIFEKKIHFFQLSFEEAFGSSSLTTIVCRGIWGELPQACAPGTKGRRDDVILTGLDEESDSTNEEMPPLEPLEPLEGAAQLGEVWLCGHEKTDVIPSPRLSWRCSSGRRSWGMRSSAERRRAERSSAGRTSTWG